MKKNHLDIAERLTKLNGIGLESNYLKATDSSPNVLKEIGEGAVNCKSFRKLARQSSDLHSEVDDVSIASELSSLTSKSVEQCFMEMTSHKLGTLPGPNINVLPKLKIF